MSERTTGVSINRLIAFLVAGGFVFLLIETLMEHNEVMEEKLAADIPIVASALGLVIATFAALTWQESSIRLLQAYLVVSLLVGLGGLYFHNEDRFERQEDKRVERRNKEEDEHERGEELPPMLAPLAFAGLGTVVWWER